MPEPCTLKRVILGSQLDEAEPVIRWLGLGSRACGDSARQQESSTK